MLILFGPDAQESTHGVGDDSAALLGEPWGRLIRHSSLNKRTLPQFIGAGVVNGTITGGGRAETQSATALLGLKSAVFHVSAGIWPKRATSHHHPPVKKQGDVKNKHHQTQISACFLVVWGHYLPSVWNSWCILFQGMFACTRIPGALLHTLLFCKHLSNISYRFTIYTPGHLEWDFLSNCQSTLSRRDIRDPRLAWQVLEGSAGTLYIPLWRSQFYWGKAC